MPYKDLQVRRLKSRGYSRLWRERHPKKSKRSVQRWRNNHRTQNAATQAKYNREWKLHNKERLVSSTRRWARNLRLEVIRAYGGKCACCGDAHWEFLTADHKNGRKGQGPARNFEGLKLYCWLKAHGFPKDEFQLLCMNCNFAKGHWGTCPHQQEKI